jgi:hypothetical protein
MVSCMIRLGGGGRWFGACVRMVDGSQSASVQLTTFFYFVVQSSSNIDITVLQRGIHTIAGSHPDRSSPGGRKARNDILRVFQNHPWYTAATAPSLPGLPYCRSGEKSRERKITPKHDWDPTARLSCDRYTSGRDIDLAESRMTG